MDRIKKLRRDQIGRRRWTKLAEGEKIQETYEIFGDQSEHEDGLRDSSFEKFLAVLDPFLGGKQAQCNAIVITRHSLRRCVVGTERAH